MSLLQVDMFLVTEKRHFENVSDHDLGRRMPSNRKTVSAHEAEKQRDEELYSIRRMMNTLSPDSEVRKDYDRLLKMPADDLKNEVDQRMFCKSGERFPTASLLRAFAVGDARGVTDSFRQAPTETNARAPNYTNEQVSGRELSPKNQPKIVNRNMIRPAPPRSPRSPLGKYLAAIKSRNSAENQQVETHRHGVSR